MQVLVVTCDRDRWQFQVQCWSFCKYLSYTTINIIVNEIDAEPWKAWYDANCRKYLWRHRVCVYTRKDFPEFCKIKLPAAMMHGWKTQQILKLLFSTKTDNPYVILDSKNWLVGNAKVEDLSQHVRGRSTDPFDQFARLCYEKFNFQEPQFYRPVHTPFWIDPTITNSMFDFFNGPTNTCLWFMKTEYPSEFIMYDLYATSRGLDSPNSGTRHEYSKTYWTGDVAPTEEEIKKIVDDKNIKLFSIHLPVLKQMDHAMIEKAVGFSTKYFYWRF